MIELRHLRYFVALAGERHFGRAAAALHVSQPLLSRQIRQLESLVGVSLVARSRPTVELTPAGREFFAGAGQTLQQAARAIRAAQQADGLRGRLVIAFEPCSTFHGFTRFAEELKRQLPDLQLDVLQLPVPEHVHRLRSGEVDIAYAHRNEDAAGIEFRPLASEPLLLVLPSRHRLARRSALPFSALAAEPFIFWHRALAPACHDYVLRLLASNAVVPEVRHRAPDHLRSLEMVAAGLGWTVAPACARGAIRRGLVFREIAGTPTRLELGISHLAGHRSRSLRAALRIWARFFSHA